MTQVTLIGILGLLAIAACWALAVVLYRVGTAGSAARKLAFLLLLEGVTLATASYPEFALGLSLDWYDHFPVWGFIFVVTHFIGDAAFIAL